MSSIYQPVPAPAGDLFNWETVVTIPSNVAPNNVGYGKVQVDNTKFFVLHAFYGSTNLDQAGGDFIATIGASPGAAARTLITNPILPNNFEVGVKYNDDIDLTGAPVPQAALCGNTYRTGTQLPLGVIFSPMTTFNFTFYNVQQTLITAADNATLIPLTITFGLSGFFVPIPQLSNFLAEWPAYALVANQGQAGWLSQFTGIAMPAGV